MRIEAVKLAQPGFGGLLIWRSYEQIEGERDDNKEVYTVDTICNSVGHK